MSKYPTTESQDNTRVVKQQKEEAIPIVSKQSYVSSDNRTDWQREQSQKQAERDYNQLMKDKTTQAGLQNIIGFANFADAAGLAFGGLSLLGKGAKWALKRGSKKLLNKSNLTSNTKFSTTGNTINALDSHYQRIKNGGWNRLEQQGDIMGPGRVQIYDINYQRDKAFSEIKKRFPNISDEEINTYINNVQGGVSVEDAFRPQGIVLMDSNHPLVRQNPSIAMSHELDHAIHFPAEKPEGFDFSMFDDGTQQYFLRNNGSDLAARGSQIKDWYGITDPNQPITEEMLRNAAQNYVKETGFDNDMSIFFKGIKDWKAAAKWLTKYASMYTLINTMNYDDKR